MGTEMIPMNHLKHLYLYTSKDILLVYIFEQNSFISYRHWNICVQNLFDWENSVRRTQQWRQLSYTLLKGHRLKINTSFGSMNWPITSIIFWFFFHIKWLSIFNILSNVLYSFKQKDACFLCDFMGYKVCEHCRGKNA